MQTSGTDARPSEFGGEPEIEIACRAAAPHPLLSEMPEALVPWLLPIAWDRDQLWTLDGERCVLPLARLRWVYDLPLWRGSDRGWFQVRPADFLSAPDEHPEHRRRVSQADLGYPIHVMWRRDRWMVLDGAHRIVKADLLGGHGISAVVVAPGDIRSFALVEGIDG